MLRVIHKKAFLFLCALMITVLSFAQSYHFVYIQAENQQPFYVKYGGKNYSSTAIGYIILPKITDGNYTVEIGFPKDQYPEQTFNLSVSGKDLGYALKNFEDKGWGLFNFQTMEIVMNVNSAAGNPSQPEMVTNNSNPFGNMLANAINDSTLNQQRIQTDTIAAAPTPKKRTAAADTPATTTQPPTETAAAATEPAQTTSVTDSVATENKPESAQTSPAETAAAIANTDTAASSPTNITKSAEKKASNGTELTFLDNISKDTIRAFIPSSDSDKNEQTAKKMSVEEKAALADTAKGKVDNPFFSGTPAATEQQPAAQQTPGDEVSRSSNKANSTETAAPATTSKVNSTCENMLEEKDLDKIKKKLVSLTDQYDVQKVLQKYLRSKCITTDQVKDLGNLFLNDEARFGFYESVYPFVYDYGNYPQLQSTLIDSYYKSRFKSILH